MKAKKYRLQTVLNIRSRAKEEAARLVALRLEQLAAAEEELARRQRALQACYDKQNRTRAAMNEELEKGVQAKGVVAHRIFLKDLREQESELAAAVEKQKSTVKQAEEEVEAARRKLVEAAQDLKAIEIHKENWLTAERTEEKRREQKLSDEIGSILHRKRGGA
jgi:flagellar export protein FliJ